MIDSPVTILQAIGNVNGADSNFTLISKEGQVHAPKFTYRLQMFDRVEEATGHSKKKARHLASLKMLKSIIDDPNVKIRNREDVEEMLKQNEIEKFTCETSNLNSASCDTPAPETIDSNPIGRLQDICSKKHWKAAIYDSISEEGPPHDRKFVCQCIIESMNIDVTASGKSKKLAKRFAAEAMIAKLHQENLDKSDDLLDRMPKGLRGLPEEYKTVSKMNKNQGLSVDEIRLTFIDMLKTDLSYRERIRKLLPDFIISFFEQSFLDVDVFLKLHKNQIENLVPTILDDLGCRVEVSVFAKKNALSMFQCFATIFVDLNKHEKLIEQLKQSGKPFDINQEVDVKVSFGLDHDLEIAKLKSKLNVLILFLCFQENNFLFDDE